LENAETKRGRPRVSKSGVPYINKLVFRKKNRYGVLMPYTYYCPLIAGKRLKLCRTLQEAIDYLEEFVK